MRHNAKCIPVIRSAFRKNISRAGRHYKILLIAIICCLPITAIKRNSRKCMHFNLIFLNKFDLLMISCVAWSHDEINDICNQTICKNQFLFTKKKKYQTRWRYLWGKKIMHLWSKLCTSTQHDDSSHGLFVGFTNRLWWSLITLEDELCFFVHSKVFNTNPHFSPNRSNCYHCLDHTMQTYQRIPD